MPTPADALTALAVSIDEREGQYRALRDAGDLGEYLARPPDRADEEVLTEPILRAIIERLLGFPRSEFFEQLGKGGQKPDLTPFDLLAHPFVLDAKASDQNLAPHEPQIRRYMNQRHLDYGVLFNLREVRVYRRQDAHGHYEPLAFPVLPLWQVAHGAALPADEIGRFEAFVSLFRFRRLELADKIAFVAAQPSWASRLAQGETAEVDVEFLVAQLQRLSRDLAADAGAQPERLDDFLRLNPGRERKLQHELQLLALDVAPGTNVESLPTAVPAWRATEGLPRRVWEQYLLRVAYLSLTRIMLYRSWEDVQLVDEYLHDGGFGLWYERLDADVRRVLDEAFLHGQRQYHWLYGSGNNYDWYRPRDTVLVDVLYSLAPVALGRLDADVLGALYETYVDEIDRDRRGQFFTPRAVVQFMLTRAGFDGAEGIFEIEGDERRPRTILDFATGSGGFLVEAARRVIDEAGVDHHSPRELREALEAIVRGFVGGEISPFPYYLTEVNLLLQVSRLLGLLQTAGQPAPQFGALGVLNIDTLQAKSSPDASLEVPAELRGDHAELTGGVSLDFLPPLDEEKLETYRSRLRPDESFDLVVGNPPYVTEANNKPLFDLLRAIPAWRGIYRGKTDSVESAILVATKAAAPKGHKLRVIALEDEKTAPVDRRELLGEMGRRAAGKQGRKNGIHLHDLPQAELRPSYPWPVKFGAKDVGTRAVENLQRLLDDARAEPLRERWKVFQGVQTGADAYTRRIQRRLSREHVLRLESGGARIGDPILELPPGTERTPPWKDHAEFLYRNPEPAALLYAAVDESDYTSLVVLPRETPPTSAVEALERWRPLLITRAEIERNANRRWWETAWPRDVRDLHALTCAAQYCARICNRKVLHSWCA